MPDSLDNSTFQAIVDDSSLTTQIWEAVPDILFVFDLNHQSLHYANGRLQEILGYSVDDLKGLGSSLITTLTHPDDVGLLMDDLLRIAESRDEETIETEVRI